LVPAELADAIGWVWSSGGLPLQGHIRVNVIAPTALREMHLDRIEYVYRASSLAVRTSIII
jgi:hypothetical protein